MKSDDIIRIRMIDLPKVLEVVGPNGETVPFEILPTNGRIGVYLNRVSKAIRKLTNRYR